MGTEPLSKRHQRRLCRAGDQGPSRQVEYKTWPQAELLASVDCLRQAREIAMTVTSLGLQLAKPQTQGYLSVTLGPHQLPVPGKDACTPAFIKKARGSSLQRLVP